MTRPKVLERFRITKLATCAAGMENAAWSCTLTIDGRPAAEISDDGNGGGYRWRWLGRKPNEVDRPTHPETIWKRLVAESPPIDLGNGRTVAADDDTVIGTLVDELEALRRLKRLCNKKLVLRLEGDAEGEYRTLTCPDSPEARAWLREKYGEKIVEFINDRFPKRGRS